MSKHIDPAVQHLQEEPSGKSVNLLLDIDDDIDMISDVINDIDNAESKKLPFDVLRVTIPDSELHAVCSIENVETVELDRPAYPLGNGG